MDVTGTTYAGEAFIGYLSEFRVGQNDSPETFLAIADVRIITPGDMTTAVIQKTHLRSPGRHHEHLATIRDSGPIVLVGNYRPGHGSHSLQGGDGFAAAYSLPSLWRSVAENNFELELPVTAGSPAVVLSIRGTVTKYQIGSIELEKLVDFTCEITPLQDYSDGLP